MAVSDFFNENSNRVFPFQPGTAGVATPVVGPFSLLQLPDSVIVDCGFITGAESGYVEGVHSVFLYRIARIAATWLEFEFRCDAPGLVAIPLVFRRLLSQPDYTTEFVESDVPNEDLNSQSQSQSQSQSNSQHMPTCEEPAWSGYLVTGRLNDITGYLAPGEQVVRTSTAEALVETALVQNLADCQLVSINVANADRTRAARPSQCPPLVWGFPLGLYHANFQCLQGDIKLRAGFNTFLSQNVQTNTIVFSAAANAGAGFPCGQIPIFEAEAPPDNASNNLLDGDFYCNEVLRTINGLGGPSLTFVADAGVSLIADAAGSRLIVDINLSGLASCDYSQVSESI